MLAAWLTGRPAGRPRAASEEVARSVGALASRSAGGGGRWSVPAAPAPAPAMNYQQQQQQLANSAAIRAEIQRFESVHPNIYSIYELLERVEEPALQNQIREHVIAIEGRSPPPPLSSGALVWISVLCAYFDSEIKSWLSSRGFLPGNCASHGSASWSTRCSAAPLQVGRDSGADFLGIWCRLFFAHTHTYTPI